MQSSWVTKQGGHFITGPIHEEIACSADEDILYEGSDDEDYGDSATRQQRYEAVGQRFLDGRVPYLITASLKGPFEKGSGWINPWQSKYRTLGNVRNKVKGTSQPGIRSLANRRPSIPETVQHNVQDSLECLLPSPESLKQPSVIEGHPFLENEELAMVQEWRNNVHPHLPERNAFWMPTASEKGLVTKRKASGSEWLKKLAIKRRRTESMEADVINTPIPNRFRLPDRKALSTVETPQPERSSEQSPGHLPATRMVSCEPRIPCGTLHQECVPGGSEDRMSITLTRSELGVVVSQPRCLARQSQDEKSNRSTSEAAARKAAATLSSPVSLRRAPRAYDRGIPKQPAPQYRNDQTKGRETSTCPQVRPERQPTDSLQPTADATRAELPDSSPASDQLETQVDESFCFKIRQQVGEHNKFRNQAASSPGSESDGETWSGISSEHNLEDDSSQSQGAVETAPSERGSGNARRETAAWSDLSSIASEIFEGFNINDTEILQQNDIGSKTSSDAGTDTDSDTGSYHAFDSANIPSPNNAKISSHPNEQSFADNQVLRQPAETMATNPVDDAQIQSQLIAESESQVQVSPGGEALVPEAANQGPTELETMTEEHGNLPSLSSKQSPSPYVNSSNAMRTASEENTGCFVPQASSAKLAGLAGQTLVSFHSTDQNSAEADASPSGLEDCATTSNSSRNARDSPAPSGGEPTRIHEAYKSADPVYALSPQDQDVCMTADDASSTTHSTNNEVMNTYIEEAVRGNDTCQKYPTVNSPFPVSQQSPWAGSKLSQMATFRMVDQSDYARQLVTPLKGTNGASNSPSTTQTPWAHKNNTSPFARQAHASNGTGASHMPPLQELSSYDVASTDLSAQPPIATTPTPTGRATTTPEPQFSIKSFASFMSPSPERLPNTLRRSSWKPRSEHLPEERDVVASANHNPWQKDVSQRRVSWAPLPYEEDALSGSPRAADNSLPSSPICRGRHASPPPATPLAELPTSDDAKFHHHFTAVARRTNVLRQRLLPPASQRTLCSPDAGAMAETFLAADDAQNPNAHMNYSDETQAVHDRHQENDLDSEDPMDIIEDVFREMGGLLETWDLDAELDQARKTGNGNLPSQPTMSQNPWQDSLL